MTSQEEQQVFWEDSATSGWITWLAGGTSPLSCPTSPSPALQPPPQAPLTWLTRCNWGRAQASWGRAVESLDKLLRSEKNNCLFRLDSVPSNQCKTHLYWIQQPRSTALVVLSTWGWIGLGRLTAEQRTPVYGGTDGGRVGGGTSGDLDVIVVGSDQCHSCPKFTLTFQIRLTAKKFNPT